MVAGWYVIIFWLLIQFLLNHPLFHAIGVAPATNTGLLGANIHLMVGWWSVLFVVALGILTVWSAWGMWPFGRRK
jgi:hypothetical protein